MTWLIFAALTVLCWGVYGVMLHTGQMAMDDPENGRYKAFLFVGIAYLFAAVFGSLIVLKLNNVEWTFTSRGVMWSTIAGVAGAIGALGVILAFGSKRLAGRCHVHRLCRGANRQRLRGHGRASTGWRLGGAELAFCARDRHGGGWGLFGYFVSSKLGRVQWCVVFTHGPNRNAIRPHPCARDTSCVAPRARSEAAIRAAGLRALRPF